VHILGAGIQTGWNISCLQQGIAENALTDQGHRIIPLVSRNAEGACHHTIAASHTNAAVVKYRSSRGLVHGANRTDRHAGWIQTVLAEFSNLAPFGPIKNCRPAIGGEPILDVLCFGRFFPQVVCLHAGIHTLITTDAVGNIYEHRDHIFLSSESYKVLMTSFPPCGVSRQATSVARRFRGKRTQCVILEKGATITITNPQNVWKSIKLS